MAHPDSYHLATEGPFPASKAIVREAQRSPACGAEVKSAWSYSFAPPYVFRTWCLRARSNTITVIRFHYYRVLAEIIGLYKKRPVGEIVSEQLQILSVYTVDESV